MGFLRSRETDKPSLTVFSVLNQFLELLRKPTIFTAFRVPSAIFLFSQKESIISWSAASEVNFETPDSNTFVVSRTAPKYLVHCTICGSGNITLRLTSSLERGKFEKYGIGKDWKALERSKNVASERWRKDFRAHFLPVLQPPVCSKAWTNVDCGSSKRRFTIL